MRAEPKQATAASKLYPGTQLLAALIVPILVAAFIMLFLFPHDTGRLFAWPINPPMSAMVLGATYLGGAYFFTRVLISNDWRSIRLGFLPVSIFAAILGIATILHWERFNHGHISFILWAFLYFTLPFVIFAYWFLNQRSNSLGMGQNEPKIPLWVRAGIGILGSVLVVSSLILLIVPEAMIPAWPWTLTPLTARVMAAMSALAGMVGIGVAVDRSWEPARIPLQA
jgi:hypothetical protein